MTYYRLAGKTLMGNLLPENRSDNKLSDVDHPDPLNLAVRSQQNFAENVQRLPLPDYPPSFEICNRY